MVLVKKKCSSSQLSEDFSEPQKKTFEKKNLSRGEDDLCGLQKTEMITTGLSSKKKPMPQEKNL